MVKSVGYAELVYNYYSSRMNPFLETVLNTMIVNGMARTAPYTTQHGILYGFEENTKPWWRGFMPRGQYGQGGDAYSLMQEQKEWSFPFRMDVMADGWASQWRLLSRVLYCHGHDVAVVDTPEELIPLALASEAPASPGARRGMATEEASRRLLGKRYCVVAEGKRLQLKDLDFKVAAGEQG